MDPAIKHNMSHLNKKIQTVPYVINHINTTITSEQSPFEMITEAPWFVRLISKGQYCVYKETVYVPSFHLELVKSAHEEDRTLATSKVLPCIMLLHDFKSVSLFRMIKFLYTLKYQLHYFLYEFLFLKAADSRFYELVTMGFLTSRKQYLTKVPPEIIEAQLREILETNS